jgi:hypothetical protein
MCHVCGTNRACSIGPCRTRHNVNQGIFLKKLKNIKFEKGCRFENFLKMGASRLLRPPAHPTGGTFHHHYISPHLPLNSHIIQQKSGKKKKGRRGKEERKRRSPVHTSVWRYILVLVL